MDFFSKLEFNRLIKELDFIDSDLIYKSTLLKLADENFIINVNQVLETHPQLKSIVDEKSQRRFEMINQQEITESDEIVFETKDPKLKTLYRQIVRTTHPDVSNNLNEVFLDAQKAYDSNDLVQILSICDKLKLEYEITSEEFDIIKGEINLKKQRIQFLESTYTWKWYQMQSDEEKNQIILNYLEAQISK
jgi:hypothetical protein